jgi:hypothetical protein
VRLQVGLSEGGFSEAEPWAIAMTFKDRSAAFVAVLIGLHIIASCKRSSGSVEGQQLPDGPSRGTSAAAPASALARPPLPARFSGTYVATVVSISVPTKDEVPNASEWAVVKWRDGDPSRGVGEGAMDVTLPPGDGAWAGSIDGPVGPARIRGERRGSRLVGTVERAAPSDMGFTGTFEGHTLDAAGAPSTGSAAGNTDRIEGTMRLSLATAEAVRQATVRLTRAGETHGAAPPTAPQGQ